MITLAEFKATVQDFIERQDGHALPQPGEVLLIGHSDESGWKRARVRPPYTWVSGWMVRAFVLTWRIDRLAIVVASGAPRQFRAAFTDSDSAGQVDSISEPRLARLVAAAGREWSHPAPAFRPMRKLLGRPWPIPILCALLLLELGPGVIRLSRGVALSSPAVYFVEAALVAATVVMLWRGSRIGYGLALALSALQLVYPVTVYAPYVWSRGLAAIAPGLLLAWTYPALIWVVLGALYLDRVRRGMGRARTHQT